MIDNQKSARMLYKKLLALYPRAFQEQLGEAMEQTFNDRCNERRRQQASGLLGLVLWMFAETAAGIVREHALLIVEGVTMKNILASPRSAAIASFLLSLPLTLLFLIAWLGLEPFNSFLAVLFMDPVGYSNRLLGAAILLGAFLLLLAASIVSVGSIVRSRRAGYSITANPLNLVLAVAILGFVMFLVGGFVVDQYPCWVGVPNCD